MTDMLTVGEACSRHFSTVTVAFLNTKAIYTYVKSSDKEASRKVAGILLYAKTDEPVTPDENMVIGGNRISLKALDLNQEFSVIMAQLESLYSWLAA